MFWGLGFTFESFITGLSTMASHVDFDESRIRVEAVALQLLAVRCSGPVYPEPSKGTQDAGNPSRNPLLGATPNPWIGHLCGRQGLGLHARCKDRHNKSLGFGFTV